MFAKFGEIQTVIVPWKDRVNKVLRSYGYVKFMNTDSVDLALDSEVYYGHILFQKEKAVKSIFDQLD
jgi:hypothetical protein